MSDGKAIGGVVAGAVVVATLAVFATFILTNAEKSKTELPVYGTVPDFEFVNQDSVAFGRDDLLGKITVVDFFFTTCQTICPVMVVEKQKLYNAFDDTDNFQIVSISVNPQHDSPDVMKQYGREHGVTDHRWNFLNGPVEEVQRVSEKGFMLPADNLPMGHSSKFALVDRYGQIRGYYNSLEQKPMIALQEQIIVLLQQMQE
ncbi:SCO family protein [bacterium]|nr:SCO family protein [bacterium]